MKFIHLADAHLGAEPESGTALGPIRKKEIWDAFRDVIMICEKEQVDLLLLPGDLFHGQPLLRDVKEVGYLFGTLSKTKVVMIAGNHDCLLETSHYYDVEFPDNVTFFKGTEPESVYFPELNTEVFGLSYEKKQIPEARYDAVQIHDPARINILIAHGNIREGNTDKSIPLHRAAMEAAGFDYAALGHLHTRFDISERIAYSGSFEPLERKETGAKGYITGELKKAGTQKAWIHWDFVPHAAREYVPLEIEVCPESTELSLCEQIFSAMTEYGIRHMYLVTLTGKRAGEWLLRTENMMEVLERRGGFVVELNDATVPDFSVEALAKEHGDDFVGRYIWTLSEEEDRELAEKALEYGINALLMKD